jgi:hypothetical protein
MGAENTRWTIVVDKALDRALRRHLAETGGKKGDLSTFVRKAVAQFLFDQALQTSWRRNAHLTQDDIAALEEEIEAEVQLFRKERYDAMRRAQERQSR